MPLPKDNDMNKNEFPKRKPTRLTHFDYSTPGYYFVTICCHNKKCLFREKGYLNEWGILAEQGLQAISNIYPSVRVDKFVVMPNHIHAILIIEDNNEDNQQNLPKIIGQYKMTVTKNIRKTTPDAVIWQRSFHDHVIRNQQDYERIWNYVHYNDQKWEQDCFYIKMEE